MTVLQKLQMQQSEIRESIGKLLEQPERSEEDRGKLDELTKKATGLEVEIRAAISIEETPTEVTTETKTSEDRELDALHDGASVSDIFTAALENRATAGQTREYQEHFGLADNQVPLSLLTDEAETRAVTPAPANVGTGQKAIIPGVFAQSVGGFLGISRPSVPVGQAIFPVLATNATVRTPAENANADESTGSFSAEVLSPSRLQASFFYSREDAARMAGLDSALRQNLSEALADGLDKELISGTNGLLNGTVLANNNVTTTTTFDLYLAGLIYGRVDGKYANTSQGIKLVVGAHAYGHAGRVYRNDSVDRTALDRMQEVSGGVRVSAHVPAAGSNRQNVLIRRGNRMDFVQPIWNGVTIIPDSITKAASGQIVVTAVMLQATKLLRSAGFYKQQVQSA